MVDWPTPASTTNLHGFLGLTGFYRHFIRHYALIAAPLTKLLRKDQFLWTSESQEAFDKLKHAMTHAPVLLPPDFSIPFTLETDASGFAMGTVLAQNHHPIAFFSKLFCPRLQRSSTYERELHAITAAVCKWRHYLLGHPFVILTDHQSLKELLTQIIQTPEQQTHLSKLLGYDYTIEYQFGSDNAAADALSRIPPQGQCLTLSLPTFEFLGEVRTLLHQSSIFLDMWNKVRTSPTDLPGYSIRRELLFYHNKLWLLSDCSFISGIQLLQYSHSVMVLPAFVTSVTRPCSQFPPISVLYWPLYIQDESIKEARNISVFFGL